MSETKEKKRLSDIEGGIERYGNSFLIGGKWERVITACCGKCGKPIITELDKPIKHINAETSHSYVFSCECGNEIELRILKEASNG